MEKKGSTAIYLILGTLIIGGMIYWYIQSNKISANSKFILTSPTPAASPAPGNHYPVNTSSNNANTNNASLPSLDQSDLPFEDQLFALFGKTAIETVFVRKEIIRKIVVTVVNAQESNWPLETLPFKPVPRVFRTMTKSDQVIILDQGENGKRYAPYLRLVQEANLKMLVTLYAKFYPLFQSAYREIESKGEFNDLLVQVIDRLLTTPNPKEPIQLIKLNSSYKYADSDLESLSVSQKCLIRVGSNIEELLKGKLRELRNLLTKLN